MKRDNINSVTSFTATSSPKNSTDIEDEASSPLKAKDQEDNDQIDSLTPD